MSLMIEFRRMMASYCLRGFAALTPASDRMTWLTLGVLLQAMRKDDEKRPVQEGKPSLSNISMKNAVSMDDPARPGEKMPGILGKGKRP